MDNFLKKLNKAKESVRLTPERKDVVREHLLRFMERTEAEGVRDSLPRRLYTIQTSKSSKYVFLRPMPIFTAFTILVTLLGGGVSYAAQVSLPGEPLYPVKLFGENLRGDLTFSAEAHAAWNAQKVTNRLEEASVLVAERGMNATTSAIVASNFDQSAQEADASITKLRQDGNITAAANVASDLEASLRAHQEIIARFEAGSSTLAGVLQPLKERVDVRLGSTTELSDSIDGEIVASSSAPVVQVATEGKMKAATNAINEAERFLDQKRADISAEGAAEADAKLNAAGDSLAKAQANVSAGQYGDAFQAADDAFQAAKEIKTLVQVQAELNVKLTKDDGRQSGNATNATSTESGKSNETSTGTIPAWTQIRTDGMIHTEQPNKSFEATSTESDAANAQGRRSSRGDNENAAIRANVNPRFNASSSDSGVGGDAGDGFKFEF